MPTIKVSKKYGKLISVRDYIVKKALEEKETLIIEHDGKKMTIPPYKLTSYIQTCNKKMKSKFNKDYELYDYVWNPDNSD